MHLRGYLRKSTLGLQSYHRGIHKEKRLLLIIERQLISMRIGMCVPRIHRTAGPSGTLRIPEPVPASHLSIAFLNLSHKGEGNSDLRTTWENSLGIQRLGLLGSLTRLTVLADTMKEALVTTPSCYKNFRQTLRSTWHRKDLRVSNQPMGGIYCFYFLFLSRQGLTLQPWAGLALSK